MPSSLVLCLVSFFSPVQTMAWLLRPVIIVDSRIDVDEYDCTQGVYKHRKRVCTDS